MYGKAYGSSSRDKNYLMVNIERIRALVKARRHVKRETGLVH